MEPLNNSINCLLLSRPALWSVGTDGSVKLGPTLMFQASSEASINAPTASHSHTVVIQLTAFQQPHLHAFSFLCRPITLKVAAVIFSYTTNMSAAVRTVWSSLASRPLYKPRSPYFLQKSGNAI